MYFDTMNAQQISHAAHLATAKGPTFVLAGRRYRSPDKHAAQLWITSTADMEGVALSDPRVARARQWANMVSAVAA